VDSTRSENGQAGLSVAEIGLRCRKLDERC
jgi:hypothetical protein